MAEDRLLQDTLEDESQHSTSYMQSLQSTLEINCTPPRSRLPSPEEPELQGQWQGQELGEETQYSPQRGGDDDELGDPLSRYSDQFRSGAYRAAADRAAADRAAADRAAAFRGLRLKATVEFCQIGQQIDTCHWNAL